MEEFKLVVVEEHEFEKLDVIIIDVFGNFGQSPIGGKKNHSHKGLKAKLAAGAFQKIGTWPDERLQTDDYSNILGTQN